MSEEVPLSPAYDYEFILVQDFVKVEDRIVRHDGSHFCVAGGGVLDYLKHHKIKLKKVEDEPGVLREFVGAIRIAEGEQLSSGAGGKFVGWPLLFIAMYVDLTA